MAKGTEAKAYATEIIKKAFGENFISEYDKKLYVNCPEAGGMVQIAIALTCPKIPISLEPNVVDGGVIFGASATAVPMPTTEITEEERQTIAHLMSLV